MFKVDGSNVYVPSKSVAIKPDVVSDVVGEDQIRFHLPSYLGFIDVNQTYIKYNLTIENARGFLVPDKNCGGHALFRNVELRDGNNKAQLELCEDYNANYSLLSNFTKQNTVSHKRELFNGVVSKGGERAMDSILYYGAPAQHGGTVVAPTGLSKTVLTPKLQFGLNTGVFKQGQALPLGAMNGMRITIDTEDPLRALQYLEDEVKSSSNRLSFFQNRILVHDDGAAGNIKAIGDDARADDADLTTTIFSIETSHSDRLLIPFDVNDILYISNQGGTIVNEEELGTIVGFNTAGATGGGRVAISYIPNRNRTVGLAANHTSADSQLYIKIADRQVAHSGRIGVADVGSDTGTFNILAPSYRMSEIEMIVEQITPPVQYVQAMMKAVMGETGVQMDILSYDLFRHNQNNVVGLQQILIPTRMTRAKSLFSQPLSVSSFRSLAGSSFQGIADSARNYEWIHGTNHYPTRLAPLERYSQVINFNNRFKTEALHCSELQKAINNVDEKVLSLQRIPEHFSIARGLTKYGQVMDLSKQTLSLRVDYANSATVQKLFNNYVYGMKRIIINKDGVLVVS